MVDELVVVDEPLVWDGHTVTCPECGVVGPWRLRLRRTRWITGPAARGICPTGHVIAHPLIYPAMITALIARDRAPAHLRLPVPTELDVAEWRPHHESWPNPDPASDEPTAVDYTPVPLTGPGLAAINWTGRYCGDDL